MKKNSIKLLLTIILSVFLLVATTVTAFAEEFDFETEISGFSSTKLNTFELEIGGTHTPTAAVWTKNGTATCYSSNERVVTISDKGVVTAVGEGTAYIAIESLGLYELYCYNVASAPENTTDSDADITFDFETAISEFESTSLNTYTLKLGETDTPDAAVWTNNGRTKCYSSDESVVTVSDKGLVTAVGEGTAYVVIDTGSMYKLYKYNAAYAEEATFDFETEISTFSSTELNTFELEIDGTHTPTAAAWTINGGANCYSSDETIVTISDKGVVTAVGEGTAYVGIKTNTGMHQLYRYNVAPASKNESDNNATDSDTDTDITFDFETAISEFESTSLNTYTLKLGETDTPNAAIWTKNGGAICHSSDENIVTISNKGVVTAVGEGTAYVAIDTGRMNKVYRYDVISVENMFNTAISKFESTPLNTFKLKLGKTDTPNAAIWTKDGRATCYSSDESVVTVSDKGVVTAVGEGTAYVAIDTGRMSEVYRYDVISANSITKEDVVKIGFIVVPCILVLFLAFGIYNAVTTLHFSNVSMKKKELPERRQTANTITTPTTEKQTYIVPVNGMMEAQKAEALINQWFAENPYVYNCKLKLEAESILGTHFVKHKFFVKRAVIEYSVADVPQPYQYGVAFIYKYCFFGSIGYNNAKQLADWQANNTDCEIISTHFEGRIEHSVNNGMPTAQYYNYVFFKK